MLEPVSKNKYSGYIDIFPFPVLLEYNKQPHLTCLAGGIDVSIKIPPFLSRVVYESAYGF